MVVESKKKTEEKIEAAPDVKDAPKMVERFVPDVPMIANIITAMPYARNITELGKMTGYSGSQLKKLKKIVQVLKEVGLLKESS